MFIFRTSNRTRYARAVRHMMDHPERYEVISRGRDYSADIKGPAGCGWYIHYPESLRGRQEHGNQHQGQNR